jgi:hypothetical protein
MELYAHEGKIDQPFPSVLPLECSYPERWLPGFFQNAYFQQMFLNRRALSTEKILMGE